MIGDRNKVAVWATAKESVFTLLGLWRAYLVLVLVTVVLSSAPALTGLYDGVAEPPATGGQVPGPSGPPFQDLGWAPVVFGAFGLLIAAFYSIVWFRYVLLGAGGALKLTLAVLAGMVVRYAVYAVLLFLISSLAVIPVALIATVLAVVAGPGQPVNPLAAVPVIMAMYLMMLLVVSRFSPIFPAIAVQRRLGFRASWRMVGGNTWRLFFVFLLTSLPVGLIAYGLLFAVASSLGLVLFDPKSLTSSLYFVLTAALSPLTMLSVFLPMTALALVFRDLTPLHREQDAQT